MKIKRFDCSYHETYEEADGEFVKYSDLEKLLKLLKFAEQELRFVVPEADSESEYDFCLVCGNPEYLHKENCQAVKWQKEVQEILKANS